MLLALLNASLKLNMLSILPRYLSEINSFDKTKVGPFLCGHALDMAVLPLRPEVTRVTALQCTDIPPTFSDVQLHHGGTSRDAIELCLLPV